MRKVIWLLRIVIVVGVFAGLMHSNAPGLASWSMAGDTGEISRTIHFDQRTVVRVALTMISLSLL